MLMSNSQKTTLDLVGNNRKYSKPQSRLGNIKFYLL